MANCVGFGIQQIVFIHGLFREILVSFNIYGFIAFGDNFTIPNCFLMITMLSVAFVR